MNASPLARLLAFALVLTGACSPSATTSDASAETAAPDATLEASVEASVEASADVAPDAPALDVQPYDAQPTPCGSRTCSATQVCVYPCSGVRLETGTGQPDPQCVDVPARCLGGAPNCGCVQPSPCPDTTPRSGGFPYCMDRSPGVLACFGCA